MDWQKIKSTLVTLAPWIAGTFGTPATGVAVKALCGVFGLDSNSATPESVQAAIAGATPDQLLALKQADLKHQEFMKQLDYDSLDKLAMATVEDRNSARQMQQTTKSKMPAWLAAYAMIAFTLAFLSLALGLNIASGMRDTFILFCGTLIALVKDVYGFVFGSSAGSQAKDTTISEMAKTDNKG